jgi:hypothetical protein
MLNNEVLVLHLKGAASLFERFGLGFRLYNPWIATIRILLISNVYVFIISIKNNKHGKRGNYS